MMVLIPNTKEVVRWPISATGGNVFFHSGEADSNETPNQSVRPTHSHCFFWSDESGIYYIA